MMQLLEDDIEFNSGKEEVEQSIKKKKKRRFSDEQIRSLEIIFSSETKIEQKKKVQVATELGLQPRQVAIWFQNKRARWKSKQIEKSYKVLKDNYDNLKSRFEVVRKEKESLLEQLQELQSLAEKSLIANTTDTSGLLPEIEHQGKIICSDDDRSRNMECLAKDQVMNIGENIDGAAMISPLKWCGFDALNYLFDQSSTNSHWWGSWT